MKTVLVVDADRSFLDGLLATLSRFQNEFTLRTAENGEQALTILQSESVHLLVTALDLPIMDGFELLDFVLQNRPSAEVVVMGSAEWGRLGQVLTADGAFHYLQKPVAAQVLLDLIRDIFADRAKGHLRGLSLSGFLQLLNSERRSCSLTVRSGSETGRVDLFEGEVVNAAFGDAEGRSALFRLLSWERPEIDVEAFDLVTRKRIEAPLARLLLEAAFGSDWKGTSDGEPSPEPAREDHRTAPQATLPTSPETARQTVTATRNGGSRSPDPDDLALAPEKLSLIRDGLTELLALKGAIGAALVDTSVLRCLASSSRSQTNSFDETARRAAEVAQARLKAMDEGPLRKVIRQLKLHRPEEFGLVRFVRSRPNLLLYFAGEGGMVDPQEASSKLAELERLISG